MQIIKSTFFLYGRYPRYQPSHSKFVDFFLKKNENENEKKRKERKKGMIKEKRKYPLEFQQDLQHPLQFGIPHHLE